jgi:hypothetical protein
MDEFLWHFLWKPLTVLVQPFGTLTVEVLLSRDLTQPLQPVSSALDVVIRLATEADLTWVTQLYSGEPYLYLGNDQLPGRAGAYLDLRGKKRPGVHATGVQAYRDRIRRGEKCFLAFMGPEIAHVNWLCFSWGEEAVPGHPIMLRPGEAYTTDALTLEKFRGKNIHAVVLREMLCTAQLAGCYRAFTTTQMDRHRSFMAFGQLGWQVHGRLLCFIARNSGKSRLIRLTGSIEPLLRDEAERGTGARIARQKGSTKV